VNENSEEKHVYVAIQIIQVVVLCLNIVYDLPTSRIYGVH